MIHLFFDSCAIARRYFTDVGSSNISQLLALPDVAYVTDVLAIAETAGVFRKTLGDTNLPAFQQQQFDSAMVLLREHWRSQYYVLQLDAGTVSDAIDLVSRRNVGGADAIHLTLAMRHNDAVNRLASSDITVFVSSDKNAVDAARAEGLRAFHFWQCKCPSCGAEFPVKKSKFNECLTPGCGFGCHCKVSVCKNTYRVTAEKLLSL